MGKMYSEVDLIEAVEEKHKDLIMCINHLWNIIDDIDTYSDMAKSDDKLYRGLTERRQKDRWEIGITTDGYKLNLHSIHKPPPKA